MQKTVCRYLKFSGRNRRTSFGRPMKKSTLENSACLKDREVYEYGSFHAQWAVNDIDRPDELDFKIKKVDFCP